GGQQHAGIQKQPHLPSRNRCISASSCAIHPAICSRANLRGSGSLAPCARKRVARNNNSSCFCSGGRASAAASISASVLIPELYHSASQATTRFGAGFGCGKKHPDPVFESRPLPDEEIARAGFELEGTERTETLFSFSVSSVCSCEISA